MLHILLFDIGKNRIDADLGYRHKIDNGDTFDYDDMTIKIRIIRVEIQDNTPTVFVEYDGIAQEE